MLELEQATRVHKRPARGWAIHIRREKANARKEQAAREMAASQRKPDLDPSVKNYLSEIKESSAASLSYLSRTTTGRLMSYDWRRGPTYEKIPNPDYPIRSAELRLNLTWAEAKLAQVRPGTLEGRVQNLIDGLHLREANDHLTEIVGTDDHRRPIQRYRQMLDQLEAGLPAKQIQSPRPGVLARR